MSCSFLLYPDLRLDRPRREFGRQVELLFPIAASRITSVRKTEYAYIVQYHIFRRLVIFMHNNIRRPNGFEGLGTGPER